MKGIPFKASVDDIRRFYSDFTLACGNVYLKRHADGRLNGEVRPEGRGADHVGSCRRPAALLLWLNAALV